MKNDFIRNIENKKKTIKVFICEGAYQEKNKGQNILGL